MPPETTAANTEETTTQETAPTSGEQQTTAESAPDAAASPPTSPPETEEAASEADSAAEKEKAEGEKKPEEKPTGWKAVEAAKQEQLKLAKRRGEIEQREQTITQREQQLEHEVARANQWVQQVSQREAFVAKFERAIQAGDIDTLERDFGLSYQTLSARAVENLDPNSRVAKLERELAERREREDRERVSRAQVEQTRHDAQQLVAMAEHFVDEFPDLYTWTPDRIAQEGIALRDADLRARRTPTYDSVLRELQKRAKAEKDHEAQKRKSLEQRKSGTTRDAGSAGNADPKGTSGSPTTTPALTGKTAAIRATPPSRDKTEEEVDAECLAMLRSVTKK